MTMQGQPGSRDGQPRRAGRPARSAEEREAAKERRIPRSQEGRLKFRQGDPHALDVQIREARNYRHLITEKLAQLQAIVSDLDNPQDDPSASISDQESALKSFLWTTYQEHKHREHILATFLAIRRARLLAKLDAAAAALQVAADLLAPDDTLLAELQAAVEHQRQEAARQRPQKPRTSDQPDQAQEQPAQSAALVRVYGPDEASIQTQLDAIRTEREQNQAPAIDYRHIYGDSQAARDRLAEFESQAAEIRAAISPARGWYEEFYIEKVRLSREALKYLKKGQELPPGVELFEGVIYGPYLKYRWQEETGGPAYTIQMGITPEGSSQDEGGVPWPNL